MVEANLKIIEELTFFLKTVSGDRGIRKLMTKAEVDFSRDRKLPMGRLAGLIIRACCLTVKSLPALIFG